MVPLLVALLLALGPTLPLPADPAVLSSGLPRVALADAGFAAWSLDLGVSLGSAKDTVTASPAPKSLCPLGDLNGDGFDDLLARFVGHGNPRFEALAGPDFATVLWTAEPRDSRLMKCGADVTGDAAPDPVLVTLPEEPAGQPVESSSSQVTLSPVDAATGETLADVSVEASTTEASVLGAAAGTSSSGDLLPSAPDTLIVVESTRTEAEAAGVGVTQDSVQVQVVNAAGQVQGTVELPPGADSVAVAALPETTGAVAVLTERETVPVDGTAMGVPTITVADGEGEVVWQRDEPATAGVPLLLPQAGDVDGDGHEDLIYASLPPATGEASSSYEVLSGADGHPITASPPVDGSQAALPFGDADDQGGAEILVVHQETPDSPIDLSVVDAAGEAQWTVTVPDGSVPANAETDDNGNTAGFSDLTGDGAPDAAVAIPVEGGVEVVVIDGGSGEAAWEETFEGADSVEEVPSSDGGSDLVVVDEDGGTVSLVDGSSGSVVWWAQIEPSSNPVIEVQRAGDVDGDGIGDLLVTVGSSSPGAPEPDHHAVSGADGSHLWSANGDGSDPPPAPLHVESAGSRDADANRLLPVPWWLLPAALAAVALVRRRRQR